MRSLHAWKRERDLPSRVWEGIGARRYRSAGYRSASELIMTTVRCSPSAETRPLVLLLEDDSRKTVAAQMPNAYCTRPVW
eukprot:2034090-Pyramimonas_sp.AAC.1